MSREAVLGRSIWDILFQVAPEVCQTPEEYERLKTATLEFLRTGEAPWGRTGLERIACRPDGEIRHLQSIIFPIETAHGLFSASITRDITEQKRAEEAYRAVVEHSLQGLSILQHGRIVFANPATTQITGYSPAELLEMTTDEVMAIVHPDDRPLIITSTGMLLPEIALPSRNELCIIHKDGDIRWIEVFSVHIMYLGQPAVQITYIDITERKRTEAQIQFQAQLLDTVGQAIIVTQMDGVITYWNRAAERLYGWSAAEVIGRNILEVTPMVKSLEQAEAIMQQLRTGQPWSGEFFVRRRDGTLFYALVTDVPIYDDQGQMSGIIGISTDISTRKQMEEALRTSEERYRALIEHSGLPIAVYDYDGTVLVFNAIAAQMFAGEPRDFVGKSLHAIFPDARANFFLERVRRVIDTGTPEEMEDYIVSPAGAYWFWTTIYPVEDTSRHRFAAQVIGHDITERKQMEQALRASEERYERATSAGRVNAWDWNLQTNTIYVTDALKHLLGYTCEDQWHLLAAWEQLVHPEDLRRLTAQREAIYRGEVTEAVAEYRMLHRDGSVRWFLSRYQVIRDAAGTPIMISGTDTDITELKQLAADLQHRVRELDALRATMNEITGELELEALLRAVLERAVILLEASSGQLALYAAEQYELRVLAGYNTQPDVTGTHQPLTPGVTAEVIQTRQPLRIEDYPARAEQIPDYVALGAQSLLLVPLLLGEHVLGIIVIGDTRPDRTFTAADQDLLTLFAQQATIAIRNAQLFAEAQRLATIDPLTGLYNRRAFFELAQREFDRSGRYAHPLSVVMLDIDQFKRVNDTYGHRVGDQVLQTVAHQCRATLRTLDIIGRYGGEEIIMLLPETDQPGGYQVTERLRQTLAQTVIATPDGDVWITVSLGVATIVTTGMVTLEGLIDQADKALYRAKQAGRNRVAAWPVPDWHATG